MQLDTALLIQASVVTLVNGNYRCGFQATESCLAKVVDLRKHGAAVVTQNKMLSQIAAIDHPFQQSHGRVTIGSRCLLRILAIRLRISGIGKCRLEPSDAEAKK